MEERERRAPEERKAQRDAAKQEKKERRKKEPLYLKIAWYSVYALLFALMATGIYMIFRQSVIVPEQTFETPPPLNSSVPVLTPGEPLATAEPTPYVQQQPVSISFPKAELQCEIVAVGLDGNNIGTVDSAVIAGWYDQSAAPGEVGNCIINGHNSFDQQKGIFAYLKEMEPGEEVVVKLENGTYVYYEAMLIEEHPYDDFPQEFLWTGGQTRLTLITCKGDYDRDQEMSLTRVVVVCKQVGINEASNVLETEAPPA